MMRIRGTIGELPVDLTLELDDSDWARLGVHLQAAPPAVGEAPVTPAPANPAPPQPLARRQGPALSPASSDQRVQADRLAVPADHA